MEFSVVFARTCNVCGHVAIITKTESTYVMIKSTLWFDDVEDIPGLAPSPASPGGSKVTHAVKKMEWETAWERG